VITLEPMDDGRYELAQFATEGGMRWITRLTRDEMEEVVYQYGRIRDDMP
jgi:hypothetical protein